MGFVQIIDFRTNNIDEMRKLGDEYTERMRGETTARRSVITADRDDPGRYLQFVFFDSYESAMKNSELPGTEEIAAKMGALADGPPKFSNLDVVEDRTM